MGQNTFVNELCTLFTKLSVADYFATKTLGNMAYTVILKLDYNDYSIREIWY